MKTTNAKAINFKGAGVCEVKDGMLTVTGIEIKIENNGDVLVIKNDDNCFVGKECLNVAQNIVYINHGTVGIQNCVIGSVTNVAQNMTVINGKIVSSDCSVSEKKEKTVEKIKLVNKLNTVKISGACDMTIDGKLFDDDEVNIVLTGSGNITVVDAESKNINIKLNGSGNIDVANVKADFLNIKLRGCGNIKVTNAVADTVKAKLSGIGDIVVSGNIRNIKQKNTGMGDIILSKVIE